MSPVTHEPAAILTKSLALLRKISQRVEELDDAQFPTDASALATQMLRGGIEALESAPLDYNVAPRALFVKALDLEELVEDLERSSIGSVSWPVVSFCQDIWEKLFGHRVHVFFCKGAEYNYSIHSFSYSLRRCLTDMVPEERIHELTSPLVFCLRLAALEGQNIPLYANIGHEFGHVLYRLYEPKLLALWNETNAGLLSSVSSALSSPECGESITVILEKFVEELTADVVACVLMGPSFFLSLKEVSWPRHRNMWQVRLPTETEYYEAHPSTALRLACASEAAGAPDVFSSVMERVPGLGGPRDIVSYRLAEYEAPPPGQERVEVIPDGELAWAVQSVLSAVLPELRTTLTEFRGEVQRYLQDRIPVALAFCSAQLPEEIAFRRSDSAIAELLVRLHHGIPPNIVPVRRPRPDLLGKPADFPGMLLAAAMYRMGLLSEAFPGAEEVGAEELDKLERLTRKAFEVAYVQERYNAWVVAQEAGCGDPNGDSD